MAIIYRGIIGPLLQRAQISYSPTNGYTRNWDYKGFSEKLMLDLMDEYSSRNCEVTFQGEHGVYSLQVKDSTGEVTLDTWQIQQQTVRFNRLENPRYTTATSDLYLTDAKRALLNLALEKGLKPQEAVTEFNADTSLVSKYGSVTWPSEGTDAGKLFTRIYDSYNKGFAQFDRSTYVIRHTTNAPSNYRRNVADSNVDRIYTNAQLLSECTNRAYWRLPMPPEMVYFIQHLTFPAARAFYQNGWFKRGSSRSTAANFRIELSTEYEFGQHSIDDYALAVL